VSSQLHTPVILPTEKIQGTPLIQGWMARDLVQSLWRKTKYRAPTGNRTPIIIQEDITLKNIMFWFHSN